MNQTSVSAPFGSTPSAFPRPGSQTPLDARESDFAPRPGSQPPLDSSASDLAPRPGSQPPLDAHERDLAPRPGSQPPLDAHERDLAPRPGSQPPLDARESDLAPRPGAQPPLDARESDLTPRPGAQPPLAPADAAPANAHDATPMAAIVAAFAAAAEQPQGAARAAAARAPRARFDAASTTPWGAQIATPRNFRGHAVAVTGPKLQSSGNPLSGGVLGGSAAYSLARPFDDDPKIEVESLTAQEHELSAVHGGTVELVLDEDAQRHGENLRQRKETLEESVIALKDDSATQFSLVEEGMTLVKIAPTTILEEESAYQEGESEEEFIAGNVMIAEALSTGTDNGAALSSGGALADDPGNHAPQGKGQDIEDLPIIGARLHVSSTLNLPNAGADRRPGVRLLPSILADFGRYWFTYGLAVLLCVLCLIKVYQVQATCNVTSRLNEVALSNAEIQKEWLNLMAQRQNLSEHATVRNSAVFKLQMTAPQTEKEHVIYLKK